MKKNNYPKGLLQTDTELYLYGSIGDELKGLDQETVISALLEHGPDRPLTIRISSPGGNVYNGFAIFNAIQSRKAKTTVIVDSIAASIASLIALAGDELHMAENALFMIHLPWQITVGNADTIRREADKLDKIADIAVATYASKTNLAPDEIRLYMTAETYWTAKEAFDLGICDKIVDPTEEGLFTTIDLSMMQSIPEQVAVLCQWNESKCFNPNEEKLMNNQLPEKEVEAASSQNTASEPSLKADVAVDQAVKMAIENERVRATTIRDELNKVKARISTEVFNSLERDLTGSPVSVHEARSRIIDAIATADTAPQVNATASASVISDERDRFIEGATKAVMARAGLATLDVGNNFRGLTLRDLARETLEMRGMSTRGADPMNMVKMAMAPYASGPYGMHTTSDFVTVLGGVASKSLLKGYEEAPESFEQWTSTGTLTDFKITSRVDLGSFPALREVPEGAEYSYATVSERGETVQLATYGKMFSISRQAIINDDLNVFTKVPARMGRAAKRTIGNMVYAQLTGNPVMSDNVTLFHADHDNIGTGGVPSVVTFDEARGLMAVQKDVDGLHSLNIRPRFVLVPVALLGTVTALLASEFDPSKTQRVPNPVRGIVEVIADARLDDDDPKAYYFVADPNTYDTVEVLYLNGVTTPVIEEQQGWEVDGTTFKVRIDAGVKALDWRGLVKNTGVAG